MFFLEFSRRTERQQMRGAACGSYSAFAPLPRLRAQRAARGYVRRTCTSSALLKRG